MLLKILPFKTKDVSATADQVAALTMFAVPVKSVTDVLELADNMVDTVNTLGARGLAANQVGELLRIIVVVLGGTPTIMINPKVVKRVGSYTSSEGCLSFPGASVKVTRPEVVTVDYLSREGDHIVEVLKGEDAVTVCHEVDHLEGELLVDKLTGLNRRNFLRKVNKYHRKLNRSQTISFPL
jgi:peptide deformylase